MRNQHGGETQDNDENLAKKKIASKNQPRRKPIRLNRGESQRKPRKVVGELQESPNVEFDPYESCSARGRARV